jgi:hypothetical protein
VNDECSPTPVHSPESGGFHRSLLALLKWIEDAEPIELLKAILPLTLDAWIFFLALIIAIAFEATRNGNWIPNQSNRITGYRDSKSNSDKILLNLQ